VNNVQPVVRPGGRTVDGMLLDGWKDENDPKATAFLLHKAVDPTQFNNGTEINNEATSKMFGGDPDRIRVW
jgi:hypothetical protein